MLVEKFDKEFSSRKTIVFSDINNDLIDWLENIIEENNCRVEKKEWKSRYNNYVIYEYEPFCPEGFSVNLLVSSNSYEHINFVKYLYNSKVRVLNYLERCIG